MVTIKIKDLKIIEISNEVNSVTQHTLINS